MERDSLVIIEKSIANFFQPSAIFCICATSSTIYIFETLARSKQPKFLSGQAKIDNRRETAPFIANKRVEVATILAERLI